MLKYAYTGHGSRGNPKKLACCKFCKENGLNIAFMQQIPKTRTHLCKLAKTHFPCWRSGSIHYQVSAINALKRAHESLLRQVISSGLLDNIARRSPHGVLSAEFIDIPWSTYINPQLKERLLLIIKALCISKDQNGYALILSYGRLRRKMAAL